MGRPDEGEYRPQSPDTSREAEEVRFAAYRRMTPAEKWARVGELIRAAREFALAGLRRTHPSASERELRLRLAARHLDRATMIGAFGWDPETHA
jgi:hypothetical protein